MTGVEHRERQLRQLASDARALRKAGGLSFETAEMLRAVEQLQHQDFLTTPNEDEPDDNEEDQQ